MQAEAVVCGLITIYGKWYNEDDSVGGTTDGKSRKKEDSVARARKKIMWRSTS